MIRRLLTDYGMISVLLLLCVFFSVFTAAEQHPTGVVAATQMHDGIRDAFPAGSRIAIVARNSPSDEEFAQSLADQLAASGFVIAGVITGGPGDCRSQLTAIYDQGALIDAIATNRSTLAWTFLDDPGTIATELNSVPIARSGSYWWPNFLKTKNLLNVANQIAVIAIIAVGMTLVIISAGIDLSVGSLVALSAVVATLLIRDYAGALNAGGMGMFVCCVIAIIICGLVGLFTGSMVTVFDIPPFIVTLAMMLVASGTAYSVAENQSIYQIPDSFTWLGRGAAGLAPDNGLLQRLPTFLLIPNSVLLMLALYIIAHLLMTRTMLGRYVYAVGGNAEAARLSGVPVRVVLIFVYTLSGALAGLGGIALASLLKSGSPTYGQMYELKVIAAVVVGGTSLSGGDGKVFGTLVGAFIIAVIENGMNLLNIESNMQRVVLGLVILAAVLLDRLKKRPGMSMQSAAV